MHKGRDRLDVESLTSNKLSTFDRLIDKEANIIPGMRYLDVNDTPISIRWATKHYLFEDPTYHELYEDYSQIYKERKDSLGKAPKVNRRYCLYGWHKDKLVGRAVCTEVLDHPEGYGAGDFNYAKLIMPEFIHTTWSRALIGDFIYILFMSGLANRLYGWAHTIKTDDNFVLRRLDPKLPCLSKLYETDTTETIPYISAKKDLTRNGKSFVLVELDGDKFRRMDLHKYLSHASKLSSEEVSAMKAEMDALTNHVKSVIMREECMDCK